jgi:hypothetical protein
MDDDCKSTRRQSDRFCFVRDMTIPLGWDELLSREPGFEVARPKFSEHSHALQLVLLSHRGESLGRM